MIGCKANPCRIIPHALRLIDAAEEKSSSTARHQRLLRLDDFVKWSWGTYIKGTDGGGLGRSVSKATRRIDAEAYLGS